MTWWAIESLYATNPLDCEQEQIRLLTLTIEPCEESTKGRFKVVSLRDDPTYGPCPMPAEMVRRTPKSPLMIALFLLRKIFMQRFVVCGIISLMTGASWLSGSTLFVSIGLTKEEKSSKFH